MEEYRCFYCHRIFPTETDRAQHEAFMHPNEDQSDPDLAANSMYGVRHIGRSHSDTYIEDSCSCRKAPCGLVDTQQIDPTCLEHPVNRNKTIRRSHKAEDCPALGPSEKTQSRLMKSVFLNRNEMLDLIDGIAQIDGLNDEEHAMDFVNVLMKIAVHAGLNPLDSVPRMNRYMVRHEFRPPYAVYCSYCERTFEQSLHDPARPTEEDPS